MDEAPLADIDAGVRGRAPAKDHQVAGAQLAGSDRRAKAAELGHGARRRHAGIAGIDVADQAAAVEAPFGVLPP